jgi:integrase
VSAAPLRLVTGDDHGRGTGFSFGLDLSCYGRRLSLTGAETTALALLGTDGLRRSRARGAIRDDSSWSALARLARPLDDALGTLHHNDSPLHRQAAADAAALVLARCAAVGRSWWSWTPADWRELIGGNATLFRAAIPWRASTTVRPFVIALAYLLGGFDQFHTIGMFDRLYLAELVFGPSIVDDTLAKVASLLGSWGYRGHNGTGRPLPGAFSQFLLLNRSPLMADLTSEAFDRLREHPSLLTTHHRHALFGLQRAAAAAGHCHPPVRYGSYHMDNLDGVDPAWAQWVERWHTTSTLTPRVRSITRCIMAKAGRWLAAEHPDITEPGQWTRATCAAWLAAVDRMRVGDYVWRTDALADRAGTPIAPRTKVHHLTVSRMFFRDCQEWEWIPRRFNPSAALAASRSITALIGTDPRVIADDVWAKLLWAGLNLAPADFPASSAGSYYPMELVRAVTLTWLFAGLRSDEIHRLRVGCIRWQHNGIPVSGDSPNVLAADAVCLLDIPVHKTGTAFTKPVDPLLGQAIEAWQALRPAQPTTIDRKTGEHVDMLFAVRAHPVARNYINRTIIPALCRKAGVPDTDVRGKITSHRARSTIATQLYNAKEPMTLFELQAWLGHGTPTTTQHYAKITPNTLAQAYSDAGYFARNVRTIEVLVDRDAVTTGAAAAGQPWQHYDLGHGYCGYSFFEQCPHRMACARCDFYTPKDSTKAQLLEAKDNLQHMLASIPLTDDERAAVDDGQTALEALIGRLADIPTPAGQTPNQLGLPPTATLLPVIDVRQRRLDQL